MEHVLDLANRGLIELRHCLLLGLLVDKLEITFEHGAALAELIVELFLKNLVCVHHGFLAFVFADVAPAGLNRGHGTRIDRIDVRFGQVVKHFTVQRLVVQLLGLDPVHNLAAQSVHLLHEFGPQVVQGNVRQVLKLVLLGQRANHCAAISFFKETLQ